MALFSSILFIVVFSTVNGEYVEFEGKCPDLTPLEDVNESELAGVHYTTAETDNLRHRTDIVDRMIPLPNGDFTFFDNFISEGYGCSQTAAYLEKIEKGKYMVAASSEDYVQGVYDGYTVNFLSSSVIFICHDKADQNKFDAKVMVQSRKADDRYDSGRQEDVEDLLKSKNLEFMNDYLHPVRQNNECPIPEAE